MRSQSQEGVPAWAELLNKLLNYVVDIPAEYIPRIIVSLDHYAAYMKATSRDEGPYQEVAEFLKRKPVGKEESTERVGKRKRA